MIWHFDFDSLFFVNYYYHVATHSSLFGSDEEVDSQQPKRKKKKPNAKIIAKRLAAYDSDRESEEEEEPSEDDLLLDANGDSFGEEEVISDEEDPSEALQTGREPRSSVDFPFGDMDNTDDEDDLEANFDKLDEALDSDASFEINEDDEFDLDDDDDDEAAEGEASNDEGQDKQQEDDDDVETNIAQSETFVLPSGQTIEKDSMVAPDIAIVQQRIQDVSRVLSNFNQLRDPNRYVNSFQQSTK